MEETRIPKNIIYMNLETTGLRDQEIDDKMKWGRMEDMVQKGGR